MNTEMRITREEMIANIIAAQYSVNDQIAILRQKDSKPEEYKEFYNFAEEVKANVTAEYEAIALAEAKAALAQDE